MDESADLKHVLMTSSQLDDSYKESNNGKQRTIIEICLRESDRYVQARNLLLMKVLTTQDKIPTASRVDAFLSLLYNTTIDEDTFRIMKLALNR